MAKKRSKFKRFIYKPTGLNENDLLILEQALNSAGIDTVRTKRFLTSPAINMSVNKREVLNWIETGRQPVLDQLVDEAFCEILEADDLSQCRCSDCYACCAPPESWLVIPQKSTSCQKSQARRPSRERLKPKKLKDPLFKGARASYGQ